MSAPTGRIIRVNMMANETDLMSVPNSLAISFRTKTIRKKSNASRVQPKYAAIVTFLCSRVQLISIVLLSIGVGVLALTLIHATWLRSPIRAIQLAKDLEWHGMPVTKGCDECTPNVKRLHETACLCQCLYLDNRFRNRE